MVTVVAVVTVAANECVYALHLAMPLIQVLCTDRPIHTSVVTTVSILVRGCRIPRGGGIGSGAFHRYKGP